MVAKLPHVRPFEPTFGWKAAVAEGAQGSAGYARMAGLPLVIPTEKLEK